MLPGAMPADDLCYGFSFRLQGRVGNLVTYKSTNHLASISNYFKDHLDSPLRWCSSCHRRHGPLTICLPSPYFDDDTIRILWALADEKHTFDWQAVQALDVLFIITYFSFNEQYSWKFFQASLRPPASPHDLVFDDTSYILAWIFDHNMSHFATNFIAWLSRSTPALHDLSVLTFVTQQTRYGIQGIFARHLSSQLFEGLTLSVSNWDDDDDDDWIVFSFYIQLWLYFEFSCTFVTQFSLFWSI